MIPRAFIDVEAVNILAVGIPPDFARIREDSRFAATVTIAFDPAGIALRRRMINSINQLPPPLFEKGRNVQPCEKTGKGTGVKEPRKPSNSWTIFPYSSISSIPVPAYKPPVQTGRDGLRIRSPRQPRPARYNHKGRPGPSPGGLCRRMAGYLTERVYKDPRGSSSMRPISSRLVTPRV